MTNCFQDIYALRMYQILGMKLMTMEGLAINHRRKNDNNL